jgi:hypothetical protein
MSYGIRKRAKNKLFFFSPHRNTTGTNTKTQKELEKKERKREEEHKKSEKKDGTPSTNMIEEAKLGR